jgi:hypothetical protein
VGRSVVITEYEDDLGLGTNNDSFNNGNSGKPILIGIIGVSDSFVEPKFESDKEVKVLDIADIMN